jgi:predicted alpha/beta-hydrolase family hydrolase
LLTTARDVPSTEPRAVLVLAHGAGGNLDDALLRSLGERLAARELEVVRFNFPYRDAGRKMPGPARESEAAFRQVADEARRDGVPLLIGGKSYGGRIATHIAADGYDTAGLILLSYPLHPPGQFEKLRTEHLDRIGVPMLVVRGTNDPFSRQDLFHAAFDVLPAARVVSIDGGDHSLRVKGRPAAEVMDEVASAIDDAVSEWCQ